MAAPAGPAAKPSRLPCLMLWLVAGALLAGCAGTPPRPSRPPATAAVALAALSMLGTPYVSGGTSPRGFDCSGLVQYSYAQAGIHVPRTARGQFESSEPVPTSAMHAGDALFFRTGWLRRWHVGILSRRRPVRPCTIEIRCRFYRDPRGRLLESPLRARRPFRTMSAGGGHRLRRPPEAHRPSGCRRFCIGPCRLSRFGYNPKPAVAAGCEPRTSGPPVLRQRTGWQYREARRQ